MLKDEKISHGPEDESLQQQFRESDKITYFVWKIWAYAGAFKKYSVLHSMSEVAVGKFTMLLVNNLN